MATLSVTVVSAATAADESWVQVGGDVDGEASFDGSGRSVALSADGRTMAVGAPGNDGNFMDAGHVRVHRLIGGVWVQVGADIEGTQNSGRSVALSADGNTVAVGSPAGRDGNVRVLRLDGGDWVQLGANLEALVRPSEAGRSVALSADGNTVALGAPVHPGGGLALVFALDAEGSWVQVGQPLRGNTADDTSGLHFGASVALSADGRTVAVGEPLARPDGQQLGRVRVYGLASSGLRWRQVGADINGEAKYDFLGESVALSADGQTVATGARGSDSNGEDSGHARVFERGAAGDWVQVGESIDGEAASDWAGHLALSADGYTLAIGATDNDGNGDDSGHARVFQRGAGDAWLQVGADIDGEAPGDFAGTSVALSADGRTLAVGAPGSNGNGRDAGHARVFQLGSVIADAVIGNRVWDDLDGDGIQDSGEPGVAGVRIDLLDVAAGDTVAHTVTTNASGRWTQPIDPSIEWKIRVHAPAGRSFTIRDAGTNDGRDSDVFPLGRTARIPAGTLTPGGTNDSFDAGLAPEVSDVPDAVIGNRVWDDLDGDGIQDTGEPGLAGVRIDLLDVAAGDTVAYTVTTNANGRWTQPVDPTIEWKLQVHAPPGRSFTIRDAGTNDNRDSDVFPLGRTARIPAGTLIPGDTNDSFDAGLAPATPNAVIGNRVWDDLDGDGIQDTDEPGVAGVRIDLRIGGVIVHTVTTDSNGRWTQPVDRTREWRVRVHAPAGRSFTTRDAGTNDNRDSDVYLANGVVVIPAGTLSAGDTNDSFDAGLAPL